MRTCNLKGLLVLENRFSSSYNVNVFGTSILPIISSKDKLLIKCLFDLCHISDSTTLSRTGLHLIGVSNILNLLRSGPTSCFWSNQRKSVSTLIKNCLGCRKSSPLSCDGYNYKLRDPYLFKIFTNNMKPFKTIFVDCLADIEISYFKNSRKGSYKISILGDSYQTE